MTDKRWDAYIPICTKDIDCGKVEGMLTERFKYYQTYTLDATEFANGTGCYLNFEPFCPGPRIAFENYNFDAVPISNHWEGDCTNIPEPEPVYSTNESSDTLWLPYVAICVTLLGLLAFIVPSCLCCCGVTGKKTCWYDCFKSKKNKAKKYSVQGVEPEIYQALADMTEEFGVRPEKIRAYVEVLEKYDVNTKNALFFLKKEELDMIATECCMGPPTKAKFEKLWVSGQNRQQPELHTSRQPGSHEDVEALALGSPDFIEALPPGVQPNKSMKEEQAKLVRAYTRLNLTKDEVTGDEESKKKVQAAWAAGIKQAVLGGQESEKKLIN